MSTMCNSYKAEIMRGLHRLDHTYKLALYTGGLDASTAAYTTANEVAGRLGYVRGGKALERAKAELAGGEAQLSFANEVEWPVATITARQALVYNDSLPGKPAVCVLTFDSAVASTNGSFVVNLSSPLVKIV